jgi:hypothetical protein
VHVETKKGRIEITLAERKQNYLKTIDIKKMNVFCFLTLSSPERVDEVEIRSMDRENNIQIQALSLL